MKHAREMQDQGNFELFHPLVYPALSSFNRHSSTVLTKLIIVAPHQNWTNADRIIESVVSSKPCSDFVLLLNLFAT